MEMSNRPLGNYLRKQRRNKKLSLRKAGESMGISFVYISEIEAGKKTPSEKILKIYSEYYDISLPILNKLKEKQEFMQTRIFPKDKERLQVAQDVLNLDYQDFKKIRELLLKISKGEN